MQTVLTELLGDPESQSANGTSPQRHYLESENVDLIKQLIHDRINLADCDGYRNHNGSSSK
ncbi:MAG: hypothetical protein H6845_00590 [Alphaproteobacteria bacterium]|nr:MAG: hypothetical protein H6845_00590 [Alphaproteobacteria bacterium]